MYMEPSGSDWRLVELVVKNFGQKPAYGVKLEFATPPTVPRYESAGGWSRSPISSHPALGFRNIVS